MHTKQCKCVSQSSCSEKNCSTNGCVLLVVLIVVMGCGLMVVVGVAAAAVVGAAGLL